MFYVDMVSEIFTLAPPNLEQKSTDTNKVLLQKIYKCV